MPQSALHPIRYCEDCAFYSAPSFEGEYGNAKCRRPRQMQTVELISRAAKRPDAFCDLERGGTGTDACGPDAKWFEAKTETVVA